MDITISTEQDILRTSVAGYLAKHYDLDASRDAASSAVGWQPEVWRAFADELGILGLALPSDGDNGCSSHAEEVMVVVEELGRALVVEPFIGTVVLGGALLRGAQYECAQKVLTRIAAGDERVAFASDEPNSYPSGHDVTVTADWNDEEWIINGTKAAVLDAPLATQLIISARTAGDRRDTEGLALFMLDFDSEHPPEGVEVHNYRTIDDRQASDLVFTGLPLSADALITAPGNAWKLIARARDEATAAVCAEAVGLLRTVLADTVSYAKLRKQFEQPIGSFQALQHRMVDMHIEVERSAAAAHLATSQLDAEASMRARAVSAAKATINEAAKFVGESAVQLHGAMGMTQELRLSHYFKRLTALQTEWGTTDDHNRRYALLS